MRVSCAVFCLVAVLAGAAAPSRAGFSEGEIAYLRGDYAAAMAEWRPLAESGDAAAAYRLAQLYRLGEGQRYRDFERAAHWYLRAAGKGHAAAQFELARIQFEGMVVPRGTDEMMYWLWRAALSGHVEAQIMLGAVYEFGDAGVRADLTQALKWYRVALRSAPPELRQRIARLTERAGAKMTAAQIDAAAWLAAAWSRASAAPRLRPDGSPATQLAGDIRNIRPSGLSVSK
jgi:TPR repeat protein